VVASKNNRPEFVVVANRLPVDRHKSRGGKTVWQPSPGGLVTALEPVMAREDGVWIGWAGTAGAAAPSGSVQ
jgi:trehalose-6-phosphate synthase